MEWVGLEGTFKLISFQALTMVRVTSHSPRLLQGWDPSSPQGHFEGLCCLWGEKVWENIPTLLVGQASSFPEEVSWDELPPGLQLQNPGK